MIRALRKRLAQSDLFAYNLFRRDQWIRQQAAQLPAGSRVLDVGAGSAPYRDAFSHCIYRTQDFGQLKAEQLRDGAYAPIDYVCDAASIPVPDGSFDAVLCAEVLEHVPEPIAVVQELARVLVPGGRLILTAPLGSGIHQEPYHYYGGFTPFWYQRFLSAAGFAQVAVEPNEGSLRFFAQEAIRFLRLTVPFRLGMPLWGELVWLPVWLGLLPILGALVPVACYLLDPWERDRRFTVGYHVIAIRQLEGAKTNPPVQ